METRRSFIQKGGLVVLGVAGGLAGAEKVAAMSARRQRLGMIIDLNRCTGCQSCVVACKGQDKTVRGQFKTRLLTVETDNSPARLVFTPVQCNQCENPPCVPACPVGAVFKLGNGIVVTDWNKCRSLGNCIKACPYEARFADPRHGRKADKCDFCLGRLEKGLEPACVEACAAGARIFGDFNRPQGEFALYLRKRKLAVRKAELKTRPNIRYVTIRRGRGGVG